MDDIGIQEKTSGGRGRKSVESQQWYRAQLQRIAAVLRANPNIKGLPAEFQDSFVDAMETVLFGPGDSPENLQRRFDLALAAQATVTYPGLGDTVNSTFWLVTHKSGYEAAIGQVIRSFTGGGGFDQEAFEAWAVVQALQQMDPDSAKGTRVGFQNLVYLIHKLGILDVGKGGAQNIGKKIDAIARLWQMNYV